MQKYFWQKIYVTLVHPYNIFTVAETQIHPQPNKQKAKFFSNVKNYSWDIFTKQPYDQLEEPFHVVNNAMILPPF